MIWQFSNNGQYIVKSGYHYQRSLESGMEGEASRRHSDKDVWKRLWKMKVALALKFFVWRACSEALPTCASLKMRKVMEDPLCPICRIEPETSGHALWGCSAARDVWSQGCIKVQNMSYQNDLFFNVWMSLVQQLDQNELEEVAVTLKGIWTRRNEFLHGKGFRHPTNISQTARNKVFSFHEANQSHQPNLMQRTQKEL
ncbi:uncharacterized protein LOC121258684 [Juglans microcarpa x Juglans regia]|uniref:uncharacterized protein LOC121258684 n=1 Tax=Juglans microcarpa x Juglans regia TaxID=2249226 RepID=UPI001B7DCA7C|nr:uncharacterized protein LOC121258684 [Juglans microcarpa x Juglans regia]